MTDCADLADDPDELDRNDPEFFQDPDDYRDAHWDD
jgi:hypothetical protein